MHKYRRSSKSTSLENHLKIVDKDDQLVSQETQDAHQNLLRLLAGVHECNCYPPTIHQDYVIWFSGENSYRNQYCRRCKGFDSSYIGR